MTRSADASRPIRGHVHVSIGQEATAAGACAQLAPDDYVFTTHRNHGHVLARGGEPGRILAEILGRQFAGFSQRISVSGCEIVISPSAAQQFALIVHELSTNALKYGALCTADGRVSIEGRLAGLDGARVFSFEWKETGGPSVSPPATRLR